MFLIVKLLVSMKEFVIVVKQFSIHRLDVAPSHSIVQISVLDNMIVYMRLIIIVTGKLNVRLVVI